MRWLEMVKEKEMNPQMPRLFSQRKRVLSPTPIQYLRLGESPEGKEKRGGTDLWEGPWVTLIPKDKWHSVGSSQTTGLHGEHRVHVKCLAGVLSSW